MSREAPSWEAGPAHGFTALPTFRVHVLARLLERHSDRWFQARFGMTLPEIRLIAITGGQRRVTLSRLAQEAELDRGQASRLVSRLIERGLLARHAHPRDQRSAFLVLADAGERLYPALLEAAQARNAAWLAVLPPGERQTLMDHLELLIAALRGELDSEPPPAHEAAGDAAERPIQIEPALARRLRDLLSEALGAEDAP